MITEDKNVSLNSRNVTIFITFSILSIYIYCRLINSTQTPGLISKISETI